MSRQPNKAAKKRRCFGLIHSMADLLFRSARSVDCRIPDGQRCQQYDEEKNMLHADRFHYAVPLCRRSLPESRCTVRSMYSDEC